MKGNLKTMVAIVSVIAVTLTSQIPVNASAFSCSLSVDKRSVTFAYLPPNGGQHNVYLTGYEQTITGTYTYYYEVSYSKQYTGTGSCSGTFYATAGRVFAPNYNNTKLNLKAYTNGNLNYEANLN